MALNFPSNPSENDIYQFGLLTYIFKNGKWVSQSRGASQLPWYSNMEQARALWKRLAAEAGLNLVDGSFEEGAEITSSSDVVWWQAGSSIYSWHLNENKVVPAGSTPASTGGIGATAWVDQQFSRKSVINSGHEGYLEITQSGDRAFSDVISGTSGSVSVTHGRGSASSRVDAFEGIQLLSGGGLIKHIKTGSFVVTPGSIPAKSSYSSSVSIEDAGAVAGDSLILTMSNVDTFSEIAVSGYLHANGGAMFLIRNLTDSAINPGAITIRWVVMRH